MTSVVGRWYQLGAACTRLPFCVTLLFCMPNCVTECFLFTPAQSDPDVILITQGAPCVITGGIFKVRVWGIILLLSRIGWYLHRHCYHFHFSRFVNIIYYRRMPDGILAQAFYGADSWDPL